MNPVQSLLTTHSLGEMLLLLLGCCCCCPYSNYNISRICLPMKAIKMGMNEGRLKAHSGLLACSLPETTPPPLPPPCVPFSLVIMLVLLEATTTTVLCYVTGTPNLKLCWTCQVLGENHFGVLQRVVTETPKTV